MKKLVLLGSTGSIGRQTLAVVEKWPALFSITGLAAGSNLDLLEEQARKFKPRQVGLSCEGGARELGKRLKGTGIKVLAGEEGLLDLARDPEAAWVVNALVGFSGLGPTVAALESGKNLALANKETLVAGGDLIMGLAARQGVEIIPIDSEHSAIFQCLQGEGGNEISRIILTASGGPFRGYSRERLSRVTLEQALRHPNWSMGPKITIDSATLMNKGLEVLEARVLFGLGLGQVEVLVHPQSIIHSMVEFQDGATMAQLGVPDMGVPIQYALTYPSRLKSDFGRINWGDLKSLTFQEPDREAFPCLELAFQAGRGGGTLPAVMNAANEAAVDLFLRGQLSFLEIPRIIEKAMHKHKIVPKPTLEDITIADGEGRRL